MPDTGETIPQTPDRPATKTAGKTGRIARTLVAVLLGTALSWQISAAGVAALAARSSDPHLLAATGSAAHPQAGAIMAQSLLAAGQRAPAAALARSIVLVDPTNDRAMRVLGLATEALGQHDRGAAIMRQAAALGWRDTPTQLWVLRDAVMRDDYVTVIQRADALARRNRSGELTQPLFRAAVTEPHLRGALADSLADQPMWRGAFFADIRQKPAGNLYRRHGSAVSRHEGARPDDRTDRMVELCRTPDRSRPVPASAPGLGERFQHPREPIVDVAL